MGNLDVIENKEAVEPLAGFEPLPKGKYTAHITTSEVTATKAGTGKILKTEWAVLTEGYTGRILRHNFNILNPNERAQQIGQGQLSACSRAAGLVGIPNDSTELHERSMIIDVIIKESDGTNPQTGQPYSPKNEIRGFHAILDSRVSSAKNAAKEDDMPDFLK